MMSASAYSGIFNYISKRCTTKSERSLREQFKNDRLKMARNLYTKDLKGHFGCVNAIEFSPNGGEFIASGGDDRRILLWNVENAINNASKPIVLKGEHHSNIFCLAFDVHRKKIFSGGNDEQVIVHDIESGETLDVFLHEEAVYGLSADPCNDAIVASACDDGRVLIHDVRLPSSEDPFCLAHSVCPMHAVMFNPTDPRLLATANSQEGVMLWDLRRPGNFLIRYGAPQSCMSVRISNNGRQVLALRRRLPPVLYNLQSSEPVCQFDHPGYYNSCTMKSCSFAGDKDQYILSGSDDFNVYMWEIPEEPHEIFLENRAHLILHGHRSIVNQVRFNSSNQMIVSSGVEKILKLWSPFYLADSDGGLDECNFSERPVYTHDEYINLVLRSGQVLTHDYSNGSVEEDPRMMAFFDSLVQRELQGWSSDESDSSDSDASSTSTGYLLFLPSEESLNSIDDENSNSINHQNPVSVALTSMPHSLHEENANASGLSEMSAAAAEASAVERQSVLSEITARILMETIRSVAPPDLHNLLSVSNDSLPLPDDNARQEVINGVPRSGISHLIEQKRKEYVANIEHMIKRAKADRNGESSSSVLDNSQRNRKRQSRRKYLHPRKRSSPLPHQTVTGPIAEVNHAFEDRDGSLHHSSSSDNLIDYSLSSSSSDAEDATTSTTSNSHAINIAHRQITNKALEIPDASRNRIFNKLRKLRQNSRNYVTEGHDVESGNVSNPSNSNHNENHNHLEIKPTQHNAISDNNKDLLTSDAACNRSNSELSGGACSTNNILPTVTNGSNSERTDGACSSSNVLSSITNGIHGIDAPTELSDGNNDLEANANTTMQNAELNGENTGNVKWEEFRRFKHQLERAARRIYRRHSHSESGDDKNDNCDNENNTDANI